MYGVRGFHYNFRYQFKVENVQMRFDTNVTKGHVNL